MSSSAISNLSSITNTHRVSNEVSHRFASNPVSRSNSMQSSVILAPPPPTQTSEQQNTIGSVQITVLSPPQIPVISNPPQYTFGYAENPAKARLKSAHLGRLKNILQFSQLQVRETPSRNINVRTQDIETLLQSTSAIEAAHRRRNEFIETALLSKRPNESTCSARIENIADSDDKIFYQVHRRQRAKTNNVLLSNPIFTTFYDNIMINRKEHQSNASSPQNTYNPDRKHPSFSSTSTSCDNPFRERQLQCIRDSQDVPKKYKDLLLEKLNAHEWEPNQSANNNEDSNIRLDESLNNTSTNVRGVTLGKKSYPSGKPYYGSIHQSRNEYQLGPSPAATNSATATFNSESQSGQANHVVGGVSAANGQGNNGNVTGSMTSHRQVRCSSVAVRSTNSASGKKKKESDVDAVASAASNKYQSQQYETDSKRDALLYLYEHAVVNQSSLNDSYLARNSDSFRKAASITFQEKQAHPYRTYKQARIPRLKLNPFAIENKNATHVWMAAPSKNVQQELQLQPKLA